MLFKTDENLPVEVAEALVAAGHDAVSALEQRLGGQPDPSVSKVCQREHRALVTLDLDFADIRQYPPGDLPGLIVLRLEKQDVPRIMTVVKRIIPLLSKHPLSGHLWIANEKTVRIRSDKRP
jgi:predicted nuclease of predicted toxin-antitoxin system